MSKKQYKVIAEALQFAASTSSVTAASRKQWRLDCIVVADALAKTCDNFDRDRFLNACWEEALP